MSLEAAIEGMTAALKANTEQLVKMNAGREQALAKLGEVSGGKTAETKTPETKTDTKAADKKAADKKADAKGAAPTEADIRKGFGDYLAVEDAAERDKRKEFVKGMLDHLGVKRATEIAEGDRAKALGWLAEKIKKPNAKIDFGSASDDGGEGGDLL